MHVSIKARGHVFYSRKHKRRNTPYENYTPMTSHACAMISCWYRRLILSLLVMIVALFVLIRTLLPSFSDAEMKQTKNQSASASTRTRAEPHQTTNFLTNDESTTRTRRPNVTNENIENMNIESTTSRRDDDGNSV